MARLSAPRSAPAARRPRRADALGGLVADLLRLAAANPEPDDLLPVALERVRVVTGAAGCAVWWRSDVTGPFARRWAAGPGDGAEADAVAAVARTNGASRAVHGAAAATADGPLALLPLHAGARLVGALTLVAPAHAPPAALAPLADFLAAVVGNVARASQLAAVLEAQRRFIEGVVDALPVGVYVVDRDYRVQLWNRKREVGTQGVAREDAIGRPIFDVLPRQDAALMRREFDEVLATGEPQQIQTESRSTGEARTYRLSKLPMCAGGGRAPTHVITLGEDVTEWKAAVERTAQSEKLAAIGQLAAGVMHEINNPLATIAACAETMTLSLAELPRERPAPPGFGEYLRIVDHEVHRCRRIIDGLLNFSRAKPARRSRTGLNAVIEQTLFLLKHHTRFKRCPVRLELAEDGGPEVLCDVDQLTQVVMALLLNAADAVAAAARGDDDEPAGVTLRTRVAGAEAAIEVADEGTGIAREALPKIFEPFFTTKAPGEGTGLGLSICYGIVRDHGGRIDVESATGVGSTFRVVLPRSSAPARVGVDGSFGAAT